MNTPGSKKENGYDDFKVLMKRKEVPMRDLNYELKLCRHNRDGAITQRIGNTFSISSPTSS